MNTFITVVEEACDFARDIAGIIAYGFVMHALGFNEASITIIGVLAWVSFVLFKERRDRE